MKADDEGAARLFDPPTFANAHRGVLFLDELGEFVRIFSTRCGRDAAAALHRISAPLKL